VSTERRRAIYLDIDGVFHPNDCDESELFCWLPLFIDLVAPFPDVALVIHSSWRYEYDPEELLKRLPLSLRSRLFGITEGMGRYPSIIEHVKAHQISSFIVIDDLCNMFPSQWHDRELVMCDGRTGLSAPKVRQQIAVFLEDLTNDSQP
jgi:hypothetical protein